MKVHNVDWAEGLEAKRLPRVLVTRGELGGKKEK